MRLTSIEISGFKSFAKSTKISFAPGITAVVGPNGCGKSNIVDALRWVLGEQRSSVLRGDRMDNVIFNGTVGRKPAGLAEVAIRIDNSEGMLGLSLSEVEIARRLHRDGTSEYLLNGHECRLKDITDLLHDSGMGPNLYSILELKMVEDILREDGEGRRMLFEEAAGIAKYKLRRRQAQQKLKQTEEDLLRLSDILAEVERQVSSLKRQAMRARKYNELSAEARNFEIALTYRDFRRLQAEMIPLKEALKTTSATSEAARSAIRDQEARIQKARAAEVELERQAADLRAFLAAIVTAISTLEAEESGLRSRIQSAQQTIERARRERDLMIEKQGLLEQRRQAVSESIASAEKRLAQVCERVSQHEREVESLELSRNEVSELVAAHAETVAGKRRLLADLQRNHAELAMQRTAHSSKRDLLQQDITSCEAELEQLRSQLAGLSVADVEARTREDQLRQDEARLLELVHLDEQSLTELDSELRGLTSRIEAVSSKLDLLAILESKGPRADAALQTLKSHSVEGLRELLGDTIEVDERYRRAIHSALGPAAYYYLAENLDSAMAAVALLRQTQAGQTTFVSLADLPSQAPTMVMAPPGTHGTALSLLRNGTAGAVAEYFLGQVVVVDDWDSALTHYPWARDHGVTLITLDGQWIAPQGLVFGGSESTQNPVDLGLGKQISETHEELAYLQGSRETILGHIRVRRADLAAHEQEVSVVRRRLKETAAERSSLRDNQLALEARGKALEERIQASHAQVEELEALLDQCERSLEVTVSQVIAAQNELKNSEELGGELSAKLELSQREVAIAREVLHTAERDRDAARHQLELLNAEQNRHVQSLAEVEEAIRSAAELTDRSISEVKDSEDLSQDIEQRLIARYRERDDAAQAVDRMQQRLDDMRNEVSRLEDALRIMRESHAGELDGERRIELELARMEGELNALITSARNQLGLDLQAEDFADTYHDVLQAEVTPEMLSDCRQRIDRLGVVNPLAIEEYQNENTRLQGMLAQRDDLLKAKQTLEETIARINETAQARFLHTFEAVRAGFQELFQEFFVGGEADLILSGSDLLEADITLWANPSGKRLKSLSLMSGGEKTMTAIALLFALYQVKPSPFCVFDEVDAPLDDANIDRFTRMIRAHSDRTQFILVTHNRRTMEIADNLYGVTMEEEGISKLVSVRLLAGVA